MSDQEKKRHPIQPFEMVKGVRRFKANSIVRYLLDNGGIDLNQLACLDFPADDWQQFAQLIGYSLNGYGELSYVDDTAYAAACALVDDPTLTADAARADAAISKLREAQNALKDGVATLYGIHPDDLKAEE